MPDRAKMKKDSPHSKKGDNDSDEESYKKDSDTAEDGGPNKSESGSPKKPESPKRTENTKTDRVPTPKFNFYALFIGLSILGGILAILEQNLNLGFLWSSKPATCMININSLRNDFQLQTPELWKMADAILNSSNSSAKTLVLLHESDAFKTTVCLASKIAKAYNCNKTLDVNKKITVISPSDLPREDEDYGAYLEKYKESGNGATIVHDINFVNQNAALVFHTLCDDVTPFAPPTLVIFTLPLKEGLKDQPRKVARKILQASWGSMADTNLDPLLSRLLGYVVQVQPEENVPCNKIELDNNQRSQF